ncbi:hypothetical protein SAMN05421741_1388 [Paenimyroides ummariense]|uniref:Uncharacterized protein n=1 Tax=Paenimyroides ummariense TaxID=913024 RepID=A0A1I5GB58_9FLAO|nr:hypothetical protein [Paenimyroides ummariense]SFO33172.1 hypothetical protein SAMN05421741_1388 [Paenimyroides ummariense]
MKKIPFLTFLLSIILLVSCNNKNSEEQLRQRELDLQLRIDSFANVEKEYQALLQMKDSIVKADSLRILNDSLSSVVKFWPQHLAGRWNGRLVCVESNCSDYVIGDQRVDTWEFKSDSLNLYADLLNNKNQIVRTYNAAFNGNNIVLSFKTDPAVSKTVAMQTTLSEINNDKMKGSHTITIDSDCTAKFTVEFTRPSSNKK